MRCRGFIVFMFWFLTELFIFYFIVFILRRYLVVCVVSGFLLISFCFWDVDRRFSLYFVCSHFCVFNFLVYFF